MDNKIIEEKEEKNNFYLSIIPRNTTPRRNYKIKKVPFMEFRDNKIQGVVSSGSSVERVYVCVINLEDKTFTCHTNNNRPCGGLRERMCSHIKALLDVALRNQETELLFMQYDFDFFDPDGSRRYSDVFTRFQEQLHFLEIKMDEKENFPEMNWFVGDLS